MKFQVNKTYQDYFGKDQTATLKGICIIMVFLHHFAEYISYPEFTHLIYAIGPAAVDAFFFIAGYATLLKLEKIGKKPGKEFLIDRALRVYMPITLLGIHQNNFLVGLFLCI